MHSLPVARRLAPTAIHVHMCCMYNKSAPSSRGTTESDQNGRWWSNEEGGRKRSREREIRGKLRSRGWKIAHDCNAVPGGQWRKEAVHRVSSNGLQISNSKLQTSEF